MDNRHGLDTLIRLGLTSRQAKIYLATLKLNQATAKIISDTSGVRRENVYRLIPKLIKNGLIEEEITHPVHFKAVPIKDAVSILLSSRKKNIDELEKSAKELIRSTEEKNKKEFVYEEKGQFILIPAKRALIKKKSQAVKNTKISLDIVTNFLRYFQGSSIYFNPILEAAKRGVQVRLIIQEPKSSINSRSLSPEYKMIQELEKYSPIRVRYFPELITTIIAIFDKKELCIITSPDLKLEDSPALWTNHHSLIEMAQTYFTSKWNNSKTSIHQNVTKKAF